MFRFAKNASAALALAGLLLSQPAMAVRSAESLPAPGAKVSAVGRVASPVRSSDQLVGVPIIAWVIAGAVIIATIAIVASDKNNKKSPG
jgi:hypothetical protein